MCLGAGVRMLTAGRNSADRTVRTGEQRKECAMTTPSITHPMPVHQAMGRSLRILLAAVALVILVTVAFVVGRVTVSSNPAPAQAPAVHAQAPLASVDNGRMCQIGHYRGSC
jgi:hypothetical protein